MKSSNNYNLNQLYQILQITAEGLCEAVILIAELPPELYKDTLLSCKGWLTILQSDFEKFEKEFIGAMQNGKE